MKLLFLVPSAIFLAALAFTDAQAAFTIQRPDQWQSRLHVVSADPNLGWSKNSAAELSLHFEPSQPYAVLKIQHPTPCNNGEMCVQVLPPPEVRVMPMGPASILKCGIKFWSARDARISIPEIRETLEVYDYSDYSCGTVPERTLVARFRRVDQLKNMEMNAYFEGTVLEQLR